MTGHVSPTSHPSTKARTAETRKRAHTRSRTAVTGCAVRSVGARKACRCSSAVPLLGSWDPFVFCRLSFDGILRKNSGTNLRSRPRGAVDRSVRTRDGLQLPSSLGISRMPFIGRDWRSPGEAWVKTGEGWEKKKILEFYCCSADSLDALEGPAEFEAAEALVEADSVNSDGCFEPEAKQPRLLQQQPHCQITLKCTREVAGYNTISEAFRRLDFRNGIKDVRRFNYICKLLHLLITENLTTLSGCASRVLFTMLEEVASQVADSRQNTHILQLLLGDLERTLRKYHCWGRPLGSSQLWEQHLATLQRIWEVQRHIELGGPPLAKGSPQLPHLPPELLREVLLRLADYRDLGSSGQAHPVLGALLEEEHVWRQLCLFHFGPQKLEAWRKAPSSGSGPQWRLLFHRLRKKHGLREEYADSLLLCRHCRCLFWKSFGHPCLKVPRDEEAPEEGDGPLAPTSVVPVCIPVTPQAFLQYFSL